MKASTLLLAAVLAAGCAGAPAQQAESDDSAKAYTSTSAAQGGFGDQAASRSWEMTAVTGELQGKLDSKTAKVGDRVTLKTTGKVQVSDGTVIPRGSRLVGHISQVQAHDNDRAIAQIAIVFDHVELKNGQSLPVHTLIRTVRPSGSMAMLTSPMGSMSGNDTMSASTMGSGSMGGMGAGRGGAMGGGGLGAGADASTEAGGLGAGSIAGPVSRTGNTTAAATDPSLGSGVPTGMGPGATSRDDSAVQLAGHGDAPIDGGAHAAAAQRAVPRPTGIPGIMLAGSSASSGLLLDADRRDIQFDSGTRFEIGVVADP